jgi:hypothetical protein
MMVRHIVNTKNNNKVFKMKITDKLRAITALGFAATANTAFAVETIKPEGSDAFYGILNFALNAISIASVVAFVIGLLIMLAGDSGGSKTILIYVVLGAVAMLGVTAYIQFAMDQQSVWSNLIFSKI